MMAPLRVHPLLTAVTVILLVAPRMDRARHVFVVGYTCNDTACSDYHVSTTQIRSVPDEYPPGAGASPIPTGAAA